MKKSLQIARTELNILFFSPIAWVLLVIFMVQGGLAFSGLLATKEASQALGSTLPSLTQDLFGGNTGFFTVMRQYLYLYVPLLTMGLLSREMASGSIKLLQSSPVTSWQIVWGKYLAMLAYCLFLVAILCIYALIGAWSVENMDWGYVISALFGIFLLLAAYSAIGLFLSSLTSYQVVAAISTLAVLGALSYIGEVGKGIEFIRDITYWFAMDRHTAYALRGLLSSKDISYFILIVFLFLMLTLMKLQSGRTIESGSRKALRYIVLVVFVIGLGIITSLPSLSVYNDLTRFNTQSYSPQSVETLRRIQGPVTLTTYPNVFGNFAHIGAPKFRNFESSSFEQIQRYLPQLNMVYVPYYDEDPGISLDPNIPVEEQALRKSIAYGYDFLTMLKPDSIRSRIDLSGEHRQFVRMLTLPGGTTPLRMYFDQPGYPLEREIMAAVHRVLDGPARVAVMANNEERSIYGDGDADYQTFTTAPNSRGSWINQGASFVEIRDRLDLLHPDSIDVLIIADPFRPYDAVQLTALRDYIALGGNLLLAGEPHKQAILNPLAETFGVNFAPGQLWQEHEEVEADLILGHFSPDLEGSDFKRTKDSIITMPHATFLNLDGARDLGYTVRPVLETDARRVWSRPERLNLKVEPVVFRPEQDEKTHRILAVALTRDIDGRKQRIFVAGDADFLSKAEFSRFNLRGGNSEFTYQLLRWFSGGTYPVDINTSEPIDNRILFDKGQIQTVRTATVFILPLLLALWGAFTIINRKRK